MARTFSTKTPGAFAPEQDAAADSTDAPQQEVVMQPAPDIAAMIAAEVRKGVAAALASNARANVVAAPANLPDQSEIDPEKIDSAVLTKQGWVVPAKYGSFAADVVKR